MGLSKGKIILITIIIILLIIIIGFAIYYYIRRKNNKRNVNKQTQVSVNFDNSKIIHQNIIQHNYYKSKLAKFLHVIILLIML